MITQEREKLTEMLNLRLSENFRTRIDRTAKKAGTSPSDYVRSVLLTAMDKDEERKRLLRKKLEEMVHPLVKDIIRKFCDSLQLDLADIVEALLINHAAMLEAYERCGVQHPNHVSPFLCDNAGVLTRGYELFTYLSKRYISVIAPKEKRQELFDSVDRDFDDAVYSELAMKGTKLMG